MSVQNKRQAQSPLQGEDECLKQCRNIMEDVPTPISLNELPEIEEGDSDGRSDLCAILKGDSDTKADPDKSVAEKVDSLIGRMDQFMGCFAKLHTLVTKDQHANQRKFKFLESAHNDLIGKVVKLAETTELRIESLEAKLEESLSSNTKLTERVASLDEEQSRRINLQRHINEDNSKRIDALEIEQGFTNRNVLDCRSEVKERKMIISGLQESKGENVKLTALNSINKVVEKAIALGDRSEQPGGLRKLKICDIDNVFRIGKHGKFKSRNISVTFLTVDDKEMIFKAKTDLKEENIKFFFNDDTSNDGRILKTKLKHIAQVAKLQGKEAKVSGNKVTIGSRSYFSNELAMIPPEVNDGLKQEKEIEGGIIYKGEKSILSNFYPAPFVYNGTDYHHVEQYFQHFKALHHNEHQLADPIKRLSNPRRIKAAGDSIENNPEWLEGRMMTLYHGDKAKFVQNWSLQDALLATKGKQLYEGTTDRYFACGLGYDSKRWADRDWPGENVARLILMKVHDELSGQTAGTHPAETSLGEIASDDNLHSTMAIGTQSNLLDECVANANVSTSTKSQY